jgi:hypothetical protein
VTKLATDKTARLESSPSAPPSWPDKTHAVRILDALAGRDGQLLARRRIGDDVAGLAALLALLAEHSDSAGI